MYGYNRFGGPPRGGAFGGRPRGGAFGGPPWGGQRGWGPRRGRRGGGRGVGYEAGLPADSDDSAADRPPPGLRGKAIGMWYRDRALKKRGGGGGGSEPKRLKDIQDVKMHHTNESRIRDILTRSGRLSTTTSTSTASAAATPVVKTEPVLIKTEPVSIKTETMSFKSEPGTVVPDKSAPLLLGDGSNSPDILDVFGEDGVDGDPRGCIVEECIVLSGDEDDDAPPGHSSEAPADEELYVPVDEQGEPLTKVPEQWDDLEFASDNEEMQTADPEGQVLAAVDIKQEPVEDGGEANNVDKVPTETPFCTDQRVVRVKQEPADTDEGFMTSNSEGRRTCFASSLNLTPAPVSDSTTPSFVCEEQSVPMLNTNLADKYRHLTNTSFRREFLDNLVGNQDRDWDKLSYDPASEGLQRVPHIDRQLLEQCDTPGPLDQFRHALPAWEQRANILSLVARHQVIVISGETGCGKTTQVCQYLLEEAAARGDGSLCHVVCTQPRRISAVSVAKRVARERGQMVAADGAGQVGYSIRLEHHRPRQHGSLLFCTTGVLLQRLQSDPVLSHISHLVVDEVHERDSLNDFLVTIVKGLLPVRTDLKVILMSATINSAEFSAYFDNCPMVHIPGRAHPVEALYLEDVLQLTRFSFEEQQQSAGAGRRGRRRLAADDMARVTDHASVHQPYARELAAKYPALYSSHTISQLLAPESELFTPELHASLVRHICLHEQDGAILVFVSGWDEISKVHKAIREDPLLADESRFLVLPLHSMMPTVEQREIFDRPPPGRRKIIVATNIAETSITIDDVVFVIDGGKIKMKNIEKFTGIMTLKPEWVSKANSRQRRGRAGRVQPGKCFHLYSRAREATLADYPVPEILRTRLEELCLQIKILRLGRVAPFLERVMNQPATAEVQRALQLLRSMRALDEHEHLTPLGFHLARLPMDPQTGKMLLMAAVFSCLDPVLTIASCLSFKEPFVIPLGKEQAADRARQRLSGGLYSDHFTMANAFEQWSSARHRAAFAREHFLSTNTLEMIRSLRLQFMDQLKKLRFVGSTDPKDPSLNVNSSNTGVVRAVITAGLYPNVLNAKRQKFGRINCYSHEGRCQPHPKCVINGANMLPSRWMVYKLKIKGNSVMVHDCSVVSIYQLLLFGQKLDMWESAQNPQLTHIQIDPLIRFKCPKSTAELIKGLRDELDAIILNRLSDPRQTDWKAHSHETDVLRMIADLVMSDDIPRMKVNQDERDDGGQSWRAPAPSRDQFGSGSSAAGESWRSERGAPWRSRQDGDSRQESRNWRS